MQNSFTVSTQLVDWKSCQPKKTKSPMPYSPSPDKQKAPDSDRPTGQIVTEMANLVTMVDDTLDSKAVSRDVKDKLNSYVTSLKKAKKQQSSS